MYMSSIGGPHFHERVPNFLWKWEPGVPNLGVPIFTWHRDQALLSCVKELASETIKSCTVHTTTWLAALLCCISDIISYMQEICRIGQDFLHIPFICTKIMLPYPQLDYYLWRWIWGNVMFWPGKQDMLEILFLITNIHDQQWAHVAGSVLILFAWGIIPIGSNNNDCCDNSYGITSNQKSVCSPTLDLMPGWRSPSWL